ncbi:CLUMA_CG004847, isoform A, partial [Clunio marinus]
INEAKACHLLESCPSLSRDSLNISAVRESAEFLKKHKLLTGNQIYLNPTCLLLNSKAMSNRFNVLVECGFTNYHIKGLQRFVSIMKMSISHLKANNYIDKHTNVPERLLNYFDIQIEINRQQDKTISLASLRELIIKLYLEEKLQASKEEVSKVWEKYSNLRCRSLHSIVNIINLLQDKLDLDGKKIISNGSLLFACPDNFNRILNEIPSIAEVPMKQLLKKRPTIILTNVDSIKGVIEEIKSFGIIEEAILTSPRVLNLAPETVSHRLNELKTIKEFNALKGNPRILTLIYFHKKVQSRLDFLKDIKMKCSSIHLLISDTLLFEKHTRNGNDKTNGNEIVNFVSKALKQDKENVRKCLSRHPFWLYIPVSNVKKSLDYLFKKQFTKEDIAESMTILIYPVMRIHPKLCELLNLKNVQESRESDDNLVDDIDFSTLSNSKILNLCLYFIEFENHFSGDGIWEKLNLDLVQFPSPVYINEIRIIPLGARVQADFPGGGNRLGATNPSQFDIEFFVNDLSVNVASTFEPLGKFSYNQNECINLECKNDDQIRQKPTDGLVLKGCYTTITLAVYGSVITYDRLHIPGQANNSGNCNSNNDVHVFSNDEANESDNGDIYNNQRHHNDFQDQNSSCDPTVSSTIADDLKDDEQPNISPMDIYSRSPSKENEFTKCKREWSNSPDGTFQKKKIRVSGSCDSHRIPRSPPLQSPRISRPTDSDEDVVKKEEDNDALATTVGDLSTTYCPSSPSMANNTPIESPTEMDDDLVELEPILSDDDISDDVNGIDDMSEDLFAQEFGIKIFNPFVNNLRVIEMTKDEVKLKKIVDLLTTTCESYAKSSTNVNNNENWINLCEQINQAFNTLSNQNEIVELVKCLNQSTLEMFYSCINIGLNYSLAIQHQFPGYNLRHIKAGIRLLEYLALSENFISWLINDKCFNLFCHLFNLFSKQLIPMPIKQLIARLIYRLTDTKMGIKSFLDFEGYKKIIEMMSSASDVRLLYTLKAILMKLNTNETLCAIKDNSIDIYQKIKANNNVDNEFDQLTELENLFSSLIDARKFDMVHPKKFIPIATQFEITDCVSIDYVEIYKQHKFMKIMTMLWEVKHCLTQKLLLLMVEYLRIMAKSGREICFIANDIQIANSLIKMLIEVPSDACDIAIEIAYKIEAKFYLDLTSKLTTNNDDDIKLSECLYSLYDLCVGPGRRFVLDFIAMDENIVVLFNLIEKEKKISLMHGSPGFKHKSPVLSSCIDIIDYVVRHVDNLDYLKKFDSVLLNLVKHHDSFEPSVAAMLQEMAVFLKPLEIEKVFEYGDIAPFLDVIKRSLEFLTTFPGDLIMTLRILKYLIIEQEKNEYKELKYDYYAIQLYHADGVMTFLSILEKLTTHLDQPMIHSYLLGSNQGNLIMQVIYPTVQILRKMMVQVIRSRNINFRDVTAIETLLKTYTLVQSVHSRFSIFREAKEVQNEIIKILLTYTQSLTPDGMTTTNIHKSLWTQMIGEVVKYSLNGPFHFIPGLMMLSELLPLPLPVPMHGNELNKREIQRLITERQLWSAHLHPLSHLLTEMIQTFCTSSSVELFNILLRVCVQLSDLAPNMTLLVAKSVVDMILGEPLAVNKEKESTIGLSRLFKFLASLTRHACIKISIFSILNGKLSELMSQILTTINDENSDHVTTQFHIFMILHSFFDCEISLVFSSNHHPELVLASGLPTKDLIIQFANDVIENFCKTSADNLTIVAIRSMILLSEHDVTFNILKGILLAKKDSFVNRLNAIAEKCKNERKQMVLIPELFELFRALQTVEPNDISSIVPQRNSCLSIAELSNIFRWNSEEYVNGTKIHFLEVFSALVNEPKTENEDDDTAEVVHSLALKNDLEALLEKLRELSKSNQDNATNVVSSDHEFNLPQAEGIVSQFSSRVAFYPNEALDELTIDYWLLNGCDEDEVTQNDVVQCDLDELVRQCFPPDTNIGSDCKRLLTLSSSPQSNRERNVSGMCFRTRRVEVVEPTPGRPEKKIYGKFLPRGRGFSRGSTTRGDIFRSRPPNTSRPPSLHVDDFLAMESGQPSYSKREIITSSRGRGRGSSFISRGRGISPYNSRGHYGYKLSFRGRSLRGGIRGSRGYPR